MFWGWNQVWLSGSFADWNIESYLSGIGVPVATIQGEADPYGTLAQLEAIDAGCGEVRRHVLPGCQHSPHLEAETETLSITAAFVSATC